MSISVNTNIASLRAQRSLSNATSNVEKSMERLASGSRINSAKDDAAGMQISNRLTTQEKGIDVAIRNANDGISISQTAEGAMKETTNILQRMRDLSLQASNGSNSKDDRSAMQQEVSALQDELNRIAETTSFGGKNLLNGSFNKTSFQIGANSGEAVQIDLNNMRADSNGMSALKAVGETKLDSNWKTESGDSLTISYKNEKGEDQDFTIEMTKDSSLEEVATMINGRSSEVKASVNDENQLQIVTDKKHMDSGISFSGSVASKTGLDSAKQEIDTVNNLDISSVGGAQQAIAIIDKGLKYVDENRASLGAVQNRLGHTINNLSNVQENVAASKSRIKDADFAKETTDMVKNQILQQASASVLQQAKVSPAMAQSLL